MHSDRAAPSAPPNEISFDQIFPDSIYLSWQALHPAYHNGELLGYNVTFIVTDSAVTNTVFSETNSTEIRPLNPFTDYAISVAAVTSAGIGPHSVMVIVTTDEAGMKLFTFYGDVVV